MFNDITEDMGGCDGDTDQLDNDNPIRNMGQTFILQTEPIEVITSCKLLMICSRPAPKPWLATNSQIFSSDF